MQDLKRQYNDWLSKKHHAFIVSAQSAISPIVTPMTSSNAEITNLGVIEQRLPVVWKGEESGESTVIIKDFYLGLKRTAPLL